MNETLAIDDLFSEVEKKEGEKVVARALKKAGSLHRAFSFIPEEVPVSFPGPSKTTSNYLKKLDLPKFSGDIRVWTQWWGRFEASVHDDPNLDKGLKLQYFEGALEGDALQFLSGFSLGPSNYDNIIHNFKTRFSNVDLLSQAYHQDLENVPVCTGNWMDQRQVRDEIVKIIANLTVIGVEVNEGNIRSLIIRKFPEATLTSAYTEAMFMNMNTNASVADGASQVSMDTLRLPLDTLLEALRRALLKQEFFAQAKGEPVVTLSTTLVGKAEKGNTGGGGKSGKSRPRKESNKCAFCERDNHSSEKCRTYRTLNERKNKLIQSKRCFVCLKASHTAAACTSKKLCSDCKKGHHHIAICYDAFNKAKPNEDTYKSGTFLQTFKAYIESGGKCCTVRGVLDGGNDTSYITTSLVRRLRLEPGPFRTLGLQTLGAEEVRPTQVYDVTVTIANKNGGKKVVSLVATEHIVGSSRLTPPPNTVLQLLPKNIAYADADISKSCPSTVEVLLGGDIYYDFVNLNGHKRLPNGVVLLQTFFGWIPAGCGTLSLQGDNSKVTLVSKVDSTSGFTKQVESEENLLELEIAQNLRLLWSLEALGIKPQELEDKTEGILKSFKETTRIENGRYVVRWPRKKENFVIPTNYRMCVARLGSMWSGLSQEMKQRLCEHFSSQLDEGVIEKAPTQTHHIVHYLPYKALLQKEKLRVVYDASAKTKSGVALNEVLHAGPSLVRDLVGMLINFRMNPIGITADVEKAFLRIGLDEADRDMVRFLAVPDPEQPFDAKSLIVYRFCRVPFGVISSPFLMNMVFNELFSTAVSKAEGTEARWCSLGRVSMYADNLLLSVSNVANALQLFDVLTRHFSNVGFNLRDWISNSAEFNAGIPAEKADKKNPVSVLGLSWDQEKDTLSLKFDTNTDISRATKRVALKLFAEAYDPAGWFAPCLLNLKLFIQECWISGLDWDVIVPAHMETRLRKLKTERDDILAVKIPRPYWICSVRDPVYSLHIFSDASKRAYGCVHYLMRTSPKTNQSETALVFSKLRLAPRKVLPLNQLKDKAFRPFSSVTKNKGNTVTDLEAERTIPQLELLGVSLAARTSQYVLSQLRERDIQVSEVFIWTDSTTVLQWLHTLSILPLFIENRLKEIRKVPNLTVRHVPTKCNPADYLTRGKLPADLENDETWWKGPLWLPQSRLWPPPPPSTSVYTVNAAITLLSKVKERFLLLTDSLEKRFSVWNTYVRWFSGLRSNVFGERIATLSSTEEFRRAELALLHALQQKYFSVEISQLRNNVQPNTNYDLFLDNDGLMRCKGRLQHSGLIYDTIHPILVPRKSRLTEILLFSIHNQNAHIGAAHLLSTFRQKFWVPKGRALANSIVHRCTICRKCGGGPYALPPMPPLPPLRVENAVPFFNTGVDCFGPFYVRMPAPVTSAVHYTKMYGVIFTCLVTRAVHLCIVKDMSGDQFLMAFERFTARRGVPRSVLSDNGTNFTFAQPLIGGQVKIIHEKLAAFFKDKTHWIFIPALSPWYGGVYERLIGTVKRCCNKMLGPML